MKSAPKTLKPANHTNSPESVTPGSCRFGCVECSDASAPSSTDRSPSGTRSTSELRSSPKTHLVQAACTHSEQLIYQNHAQYAAAKVHACYLESLFLLAGVAEQSDSCTPMSPSAQHILGQVLQCARVAGSFNGSSLKQTSWASVYTRKAPVGDLQTLL